MFYAVANGKTTGIFHTWNECSDSIKGYKKAIYKKCDTNKEAEEFLRIHSSSISETNTEKEITSFIPDYYVYTDGACSNNGKSNASAGIGVFFGENDPRNISKKIEGKQTNNTAELTALIEVYSIIESDIQHHQKVAIVSDSKYAILCVTTYGEKCQKKGWENIDIPNKELVQQAYEIYQRHSVNIQFIHIEAHTNKTDIHSLGNDSADKLANQAIGMETCPYVDSKKLFLTVPFIRKDEVKKLGGRWDAKNKKWFIEETNPNKDKILTLFS